MTTVDLVRISKQLDALASDVDKGSIPEDDDVVAEMRHISDQVMQAVAEVDANYELAATAAADYERKSAAAAQAVSELNARLFAIALLLRR